MRASNGAPIQALEDDRAIAILFVGSTTEPSPGAAPLAFESGMVNRRDSLARPQSGWDPYEVWRTRLKRPSVGTKECEPLLAGEGDSRREGAAVAHDP